MTHVVVLTGAPGEGDVSTPLIRDVKAALPSDIACGDVRVLKDGDAAEFPLGSLDLETFRSLIAQIAEKVPVDFNLVSADERRKGLLVADMDSTFITVECIDELADFAGLKDQISGITERAMRGELEFESALRERVELLKGLSTSVLPEVYEERIRLTPGAKELVQTMKASGAYTALISGGFTFFTDRVRAAVGFDFDQANLLLEEDGALTGKVAEPILGRDAKKAALIQFRQEQQLAHGGTLAVGDGANDLAMIHEAGLGVAFRAKPVVAEAAAAAITYGDLTGLLFLQGYEAGEIVG